MHLKTGRLHQISCGPVSSANNKIRHPRQFLVGPALVVCHRMWHVLNSLWIVDFFKARFSHEEMEMRRQMHVLRVPRQIGSRGENWKLSTEFPRPEFSPSHLKESHTLWGWGSSSGEPRGDEEGTGEGAHCSRIGPERTKTGQSGWDVRIPPPPSPPATDQNELL